MRILASTLLAPVLFLTACGDDDTVQCATSSDCVQAGIAGSCLSSPRSDKRWCAFDDTAGCPGSGMRWGRLAGDGLAQMCVEGPDAGIDAPVADAPVPDAPPVDARVDAQVFDAYPFDAAPSFELQTSAGASHNCAALASGNVRCWGEGMFGKLGYGNTNNIGDNETPSLDVPIGAPVAKIAAGTFHTCAILTTGDVRCWGSGASGRLGYGNTNNVGDDESPSSAGNVNIGGVATQIGAGGAHTCVLLDTGNVRCWGDGSLGRLGYGNTTAIGDTEPAGAGGDVNLGGTVVQLAVGSSHTCALLDSGRVRCWGQGTGGRLGYGNTNHVGDNEAPAVAGDVNVGGTVVWIAAGVGHTCAVLDTGQVRCWGDGVEGRLGYGSIVSIGDDELPSSAPAVNVGSAVSRIAAGGSHTCAVLTGGDVRCWGSGLIGQLGYANTSAVGDDEAPATAGNVNVGGMVVQIVAGGAHTCARLTGGAIRCWGSAQYGQLGHGDVTVIGDDEAPASAGDVPIF